MPYRNCGGCSGGRDNTGTYVFGSTLPVNPAKTLTSVTLPNGPTKGQQHIFAIGTTTTAMSGPVATSVSPGSASAGQQVTINGTGSGSSQGTGYIAFTDESTSRGAASPVQVDSWSDNAITVTLPGAGGQNHVWPGSNASVAVNSAGAMSDAQVLQIARTSGSLQPDCYGFKLCIADSQGNLNNSYGCAGGEYNTPNLPVAQTVNGCGGRVWLHQFPYPEHTTSGWAYCVSPGAAVDIPAAYQSAQNLQVTGKASAC